MGLLSVEAKANMKAGPIRLAALVELAFSFGTERWWSGVHDLDHEAVTWSPTGSLGQMTAFESADVLQANGIELSLNLPAGGDGEPLPNFQYITPDQYKNRGARVMLAFFSAGWSNIVHTIERQYYMDTLDYEIGGDGSMVTLRIESELLRGARQSARRWTHENQVSKFPGDLGLQFVSYIASGVEVKWGTGGAFFK